MAGNGRKTWNGRGESQQSGTVRRGFAEVSALYQLVEYNNYAPAQIVIQKIFTGKCWRGKFPVKNKSGERFLILIHNSPLYDDDGSLVGLIGLSLDVRTLEEIFSPSGSAKSYPSTRKSQFHANNRPKSDSLNERSLHSQQPVRSTTTSKIVTLVTSVTSRVRSRIRTCQNGDKQYGSDCEGQYSALDLQAELAISEENTPSGDVMHRVFVDKSCKISSDDSGEGKVGFHKIFNAKAEALLAKKGICPWKGHEVDEGSGKNNMNSIQLHDKQENDQNHQRVAVLEPFIIPDCQNSEYTLASKYEVSGSWWDFNINSMSSMSSTGSTNSSSIETVDYEADCSDYEILWEDLVIGEQVGQGCCGTVYHALWHGSDVAAKVFSKQEYSEEMINTFRQEARGMNYLHTSIPTIVHRDLKSPNLLVDKNWTVKVADFGLSRLKLETFLTTKTGKGTPQWMAPEVLRSEPSNENQKEFLKNASLLVIRAVGFMDHRLEIPRDVDPQWASMIQSCWDSDPQRRPSFQELLERLLELQKQYNVQAQTQRKEAGKVAGSMSVKDS
ncbi:Serine/threonine-protein kinase CTR1 [Triticum urartu]|uniref:Serine/threonine-protein kinase CTR1 n=1 Tax=Triticum urartu TaxID=4572 RepID=M8A5M5_TRIUA|nr:Serine/threonine-protein kinase CTR1 [Triticum urartu]